VRATLVLCRDCAAPHHRRCWNFNKGCSTYACRCRAFVLPPAAAGEDVEFSTRGDFPVSVYGWGLAAFTALFLVLTGLAAALLGPTEAVLGISAAVYMSMVWIVPLFPALTEKRYRLDAQDQAVHLDYTLGSLRLRSHRGWRLFSEVQELEVRTRKGMGQQGDIKLLEVWLKDDQGERVLLEASIWADKEEALTKADLAADLLDTTVSLPRSLHASQALPAGLSQALAALPSGPGDPEEGA